MLLSIDKVLQLISEEKDLNKIAEMASVQKEDVIDIIDKARALLYKYDRDHIRRKIIIKKKISGQTIYDENDPEIKKIFKGAELTAIPINDMLIVYIAVQITKYNSGIGIVIHDREDRQVGKIYYELYDIKEKHEALYSGIIRSIEVANYFKTNNLKIRIDDNIITRQLENINEVRDEKTRKYITEMNQLKIKIDNCKVELISKNLNDKAHFIAQKKLIIQ